MTYFPNSPPGPAASTSAHSRKVFSATEVAWMFVKEFYGFFNKEPHSLHKFYKNDSVVVHGSEGENVPSLQGQASIQRVFTDMNLENCKICITNVDSLPSINGGVFLQVLGELSNRGESPRRFAQSFLLAEQEKGYYIHNDVFRYLQEDIPADAESQDAQPEIEGNVERHVQENAHPTTISRPLSSFHEAEPSVEPAVHGSSAPIPAANTPKADTAAVEAQQDTWKSPEEFSAHKAAEERENKEVAGVAALEVPSAPAANLIPSSTTSEEASKAAAQVKPSLVSAPSAPKSWARMVGNSAAEVKPANVKAAPSAAPVPQSNTPAPAPASTSAGMPPRDSKEQRPRMNDLNASIFIKHLNSTVTTEILKATYSVFGEVIHCDIHAAKTTAVLDFATVESAEKAINQREVILSNGVISHAEEKRPPRPFRPNRNYNNRPPHYSQYDPGMDTHRGRGRGRPSRGDYNRPRPGQPIEKFGPK